jgi:glycogen synthase
MLLEQNKTAPGDELVQMPTDDRSTAGFRPDSTGRKTTPVRILLWSCAFYPSIGGIETMTELLAREFVANGHQVTVITRTEEQPTESSDFPFKVVRNPSRMQLMRLVADCDVYVHNHLSLKVAFPLLVFRRPWLVVYHTWYPNSGIRGRLRPLASHFALNVACSEAVAQYTDPRCVVIPNAYDHRIFRILPGLRRERELVFVGRLIRDKGVHLLLDALSLLGREGLHPRLTVVGQGPELDCLIDQSTNLGLTNQVEFVGARAQHELPLILNKHEIAVIPSMWKEPFGIVALEAIACGCIAVGSDGGGLREAIGPCGVTFPNGDVPALAKVLRQLLCSPETWHLYREPASSHLRRNTSGGVASAYLELIETLRTSGRTRTGALHAPRAGALEAPGGRSLRPEIPRKVLLWSCSFSPKIGGLETMAEIVARELASQGQHVTVVTRTREPAGAPRVDRPYTIVRNPSWLRLFRLVAACDIYVHNHLSLKVAYPLLFFRRPWMVVYHTLYPTQWMRGWLQLRASRFATSFACSNALTQNLRPPCRVIPNAYDDRVFRIALGGTRQRELIFVGRLIKEKGAQTLLQALKLLNAEGLRLRLTLVGSGPDSDFLKGRSRELGLDDQIEFIGEKHSNELAAILNDHKILVVPSLVPESFGIVALEAIACGCVVVGSDCGGLKEAIGPCGVTFPAGDAFALAKTLSQLWRSPEAWPRYRQGAGEHLGKHSMAAVSGAYLDVIRRMTLRRIAGRAS